MRILVCGINYAPEQIGIGKYTTEMCEYLVTSGHEVAMVTAFPYYPEWKIPKKYRHKLFLKESHNGVNVKRSYLYVPSKVTAKTRIIHELSFIISSSFNLFTSRKPDILIVISPPLGLGLMAYLFSKIKKIPFILHIQDLQPDAAVDLGMLRQGAFIQFLYKLERFLFRRASLISTITERMKARVIIKGIDPGKVVVFPNWVDTDFILPLERDNIFRKDYGLDGKFVVLYSGNLGIKQGLDTILEAAEKTKDLDEIVYVVVGDGAYREELVQKTRNLGLNNVKFLPVQPKEMLPYMLSAADVSMVPQKKTVTDIIMPSKLTGILASGRAVVVSANPGSEVYNVIKTHSCGIVIEPENPKQMFEAVMYLYNHQDKREQYGRRGREYALKHLAKEPILKIFERKMVEVALKNRE